MPKTLEIVRAGGSVAVLLYFFTARTVSNCLLQKPNKHSTTQFRRYAALIGTSTITATFIAHAVIHLAEPNYVRQRQDLQIEIWYSAMGIFAYGALTLHILNHKALVWHPLLGAWAVGLCDELPSAVLFARHREIRDAYSISELVLCILRVLVLGLLCVVGTVYALHDRYDKNHDVDGTKALLRHGRTARDGHGSPCSEDSRSAYGAILDCDDDHVSDDDYDSGFDSESEDPKLDAKIKAEQRKRLRDSGSWISYLQDYKIFIPLIWPTRNLRVQLCLLTIAATLIIERFLLVLIPRQIGIITDELATGDGNGVMPWRAVGIWMVLKWLDTEAGLRLVRNLAKLPAQQYSYKNILAAGFRHIMLQSMDFHNNKRSGELIRAIDQGFSLHEMLEFVCFEIGPTFIDLGVGLVYLYLLFDIYISLILLAVGVLYTWIGAKTARMSIKQRRRMNAAWRTESKVQNEAINNWQTVSHFNQADHECRQYNDTLDEFNAAEWYYYLAYYAGGAAQTMIMLLGRLTSHSLAAYRVARGDSPVGNFVALTIYRGSIERPLTELSWSIRRVSQIFTDSERLLQLLLSKPSVVEDAHAPALKVTAGEVVFDHVHFSYDPRKPDILNDMSFHVKPGQTVALVGQTGGGKSTVLKMLYRYYDVLSGSIRIDGQDISHVTLDSLRSSFGMVPQDPALFSGTIRDNVRYARLNATDNEVEEACKAAAIHDKIMTFPDGYSSTVGERGVKLSGGELQRVAIARALLRQPHIVLLDEATSAIDTETEAHIQASLRALTSGRTTFVIAHRLSTIRHADLILVVHDGRIVEQGTHEELIGREGGQYNLLWSRQLH